ncbi:MAG: hypothetical protein QM579_02840 [Desulfovibrio sp.]|uniref:hypothetical protein n=1 Tax=Desulfovibrio sp. TaxID=885 RepID=UPI0039E2541F
MAYRVVNLSAPEANKDELHFEVCDGDFSFHFSKKNKAEDFCKLLNVLLSGKRYSDIFDLWHAMQEKNLEYFLEKNKQYFSECANKSMADTKENP